MIKVWYKWVYHEGGIRAASLDLQRREEKRDRVFSSLQFNLCQSWYPNWTLRRPHLLTAHSQPETVTLRERLPCCMCNSLAVALFSYSELSCVRWSTPRVFLPYSTNLTGRSASSSPSCDFSETPPPNVRMRNTKINTAWPHGVLTHHHVNDRLHDNVNGNSDRKSTSLTFQPFCHVWAKRSLTEPECTKIGPRGTPQVEISYSPSSPLLHMDYFLLLIVYSNLAIKKDPAGLSTLPCPLFLPLSQSSTSQLTFWVSFFHREF